MEGQSSSSGGVKGAASGVGCVVILMALIAFSFILGGREQTNTPMPTPTIDNDAAIVREVGVIVQPIVEAAAGAQRADTQAAHATPTPLPPSELVALGYAWGWPGAFLLVCCGTVGTLGLVALAWIWSKRPVAALEQPKEENVPISSGVIVHNGAAPDSEE